MKKESPWILLFVIHGSFNDPDLSILISLNNVNFEKNISIIYRIVTVRLRKSEYFVNRQFLQ